MLALGLGDVDRDHLALGREGGAEREPEVERHPDHERDVGLAEPGAARAGEEQLVVGGHAAAAEPVEEHRDPVALGEREQLPLALAPVQAGAGHDHRALGVAQQRDGAVELARVDGGAVIVRRDRRVERRRVGLGEHVVEREVEERRARVVRQRVAHRAREQPGDLGRVSRASRRT